MHSDDTSSTINVSSGVFAVVPPTEFLLGLNGTNGCPDGFNSVADEVSCKQAMDVLGLGPWGRADSWVDHPGGCFRNPSGSVYLNSHDGAEKDERAPICVRAKVAHIASVETTDMMIRDESLVEAVFATGLDGSNACPEDYENIADETACKRAMESLGFGPWGRVDSWVDHPGGCFRNPNGDVYLNTHTGAEKTERAPVCQRRVTSTAGIRHRPVAASFFLEIAEPVNASESPSDDNTAPSFTLGTDGSNICPTGTVVVSDESSC
jgi:hypothetical protein